MAHPPRRPGSATENAEAAFRDLTAKPEAGVEKKATIPTGKELVSIRIDRDVLEYFQEDGTGWQDRINAALRSVAGLEPL